MRAGCLRQGDGNIFSFRSELTIADMFLVKRVRTDNVQDQGQKRDEALLSMGAQQRTGSVDKEFDRCGGSESSTQRAQIPFLCLPNVLRLTAATDPPDCYS